MQREVKTGQMRNSVGNVKVKVTSIDKKKSSK